MSFDTELRRQQIQREASLKIDRNKKMDFPPLMLSIGETSIGQKIYDVPFGTYGNFSALVGGSKVGKSYFKSLIIASYIGGKANNYANDFKSHRKGNKVILDFDTEQGLWNAQMSAKRVDLIVGEIYENYHSFALRELDYNERVDLLEYCLYTKYKDQIGLVIIDGIADLVSDVNSLPESNEIVQKLMRWSTECNVHIVVVIHSNYGSNKPSGHLGSAILKKSETVCLLEREDTFTKISFPYTRGFKIDEFCFRIDENGLPVTDKLDY